MIQNPDLAAIHGYLCSDGYVVTNLPRQKHKYYRIGFRNTNRVLLKDFQRKFDEYFSIKPKISDDWDRCLIHSKELTLHLLNEFGSFYSKDWSMPELNSNVLPVWLRAYFDSDGTVYVKKGQNRKISLYSINEKGLNQIKEKLSYLKINSLIRERKRKNIFVLNIYGKNNLEKFNSCVGFLHPKKKNKLKEALNSYQNLDWNLQGTEDVNRILELCGRINYKRKEVRFHSKLKSNLEKLQHTLLKMKVESRLKGPYTNPYGSTWYCLSMKLEDYKKIV